MPKGGHLIDLVGWRSGRLTVLRRHSENGPKRQPRWVCKCDCGNESIVFGQALRTRHTQSCGCTSWGAFFKANGRVPLTQDRLKELLNYDEATGVFTWNVTTSRHSIVGGQAGCIHVDGYRVINIDQRLYRAGRLAWFYVHGEFPPEFIDHINGVPDDDRICNLRPVDKSQNARNKAGVAQSGLKGAYSNKNNGRWFSSIRDGRKIKSLGSFDTKEEAHAAWAVAAKQLHGKFFTDRHVGSAS